MGGCEGTMQDTMQGEPVDLTVAIVSARGLRNADYFGKSDCFATLQAVSSGTELYRTKVKDDTLDPVWKEETNVRDFCLSDTLRFNCYDADLLGMKDSLGEASLNGSLIGKEGFNGELKLENAGEGIIACLRVKVKHKDATDYPRGPPPEVKITLERSSPDVRWGMDLDAQDGMYLLITSVEARGLVWNYNATVEPALQLRPGDFIASINGSTGDAMLLMRLIKQQKTMDLVVRRPSEFHATTIVTAVKPAVKQQKTGCIPGLVMRETLMGSSLVVQEVTADWMPSSEERKVRPFDRIVQVGEKRGSATVLLKALQTSKGSVQVTLMRAADHSNPC